MLILSVRAAPCQPFRIPEQEAREFYASSFSLAARAFYQKSLCGSPPRGAGAGDSARMSFPSGCTASNTACPLRLSLPLTYHFSTGRAGNALARTRRCADPGRSVAADTPENPPLRSVYHAPAAGYPSDLGDTGRPSPGGLVFSTPESKCRKVIPP